MENMDRIKALDSLTIVICKKYDDMMSIEFRDNEKQRISATKDLCVMEGILARVALKAGCTVKDICNAIAAQTYYNAELAACRLFEAGINVEAVVKACLEETDMPEPEPNKDPYGQEYQEKGFCGSVPIAA